MSSKALAQDELAYGEWLVKTAVVDPNKAASIRAAYNHAIGSSELSQHAKNFHKTYRIRYRRGQSSG